MVAKETNVFRYGASDEDAARDIILTPQDSDGSQARWASETSATIDLMAPYLPSSGTVLDFGAGVGRLLFPLLQLRVSLDGIAADTSKQMLDHGRALLSREGRLSPDRVRFLLLEDSATLSSSVSPGSIDFAFAVYVLQHVSGNLVERMIDDLCTVLKEGAFFFVINRVMRSVPRRTLGETRAKGSADRDREIRRVAQHRVPREDAWMDDGLDIKALLERRFGTGTPVELEAPGFAKSLVASHGAAFYQKVPHRKS